MTLEQLATYKGSKGFTKAQLAEWGISWPPKAGWKRRLIRQWKSDRELRNKPLCVKCGVNEQYTSANWCQDCIWELLQQ